MTYNDLSWIGWVLIVITWGVTFRINKGLARRNEFNAAVNQFNAAVLALEDQALEYWVNNETKILEYQLPLRLRRCVRLARSVEALSGGKQSFPVALIADMRQAVTLDVEGVSRPISADSVRAKKIMRTSEKLQAHFKLRA